MTEFPIPSEPGAETPPPPDVPRKRPPGFQKGHPHYPRRSIRRVAHEFTAAELREWLSRLNLVPDDLVEMLGRTRQGVHLWISGDVSIPAYVVAYLELLTAFDRLHRERIGRAQAQAGVYAFIQQQPGEIAVHRVAQRMGWPMGVVRQAINDLIREGIIEP